MPNKEKDFYVKLRSDTRKWLKSKAGKNHKYANVILWAPDMFHLLVKLSMDPRVGARGKVILGVVIAYFISPIDLLPEAFLGPAAYLDDIVLAAFAVEQIIQNSDEAVVRKHWAGDTDVLSLIQQVIHFTNHMFGDQLAWHIRQLKEKLEELRL